MADAPESSGSGRGIYIGCPTSPWLCTDPCYIFRLFDMAGRVNGNYIAYSPYNSEIILGSGNNPVTWTGDMNGITMRDTLTFKAMVPPTLTATPATSGGNLADGTYCYYALARNSTTYTPVPTA